MHLVRRSSFPGEARERKATVSLAAQTVHPARKRVADAGASFRRRAAREMVGA